MKRSNESMSANEARRRSLSKRDVSRAAWYWAFFAMSSQNYERMEGGAFCATLSRPLEKLYGEDKAGLSEALVRNMAFFNTHPELGAIVPGIAIALEEERANDPCFDPEVIVSTKNALMGPFAGIGDSVLAGVINPILLSIGIGLAAGGSPVGPIVFLLLWCGLVIPMKYFLFVKGYELGVDAVKLVSNEELKAKIISTLTVVGLIVIGGVAATTVKAPLAWSYVSGDMVIDLQETFNSIMPGILPLGFSLLCYFFVDKLGWSANRLLLFIVVFAAVAVALGIM